MAALSLSDPPERPATLNLDPAMEIPQRDSGPTHLAGTPPERDPGPGAKPEDAPSPRGGGKPTGMAFTITFGDEEEDEEKKGRKIAMDGQLSQFLPNKVRRSFRQREMEMEERHQQQQQQQDSSSTDQEPTTPKV